jgi:hypothetical protein
MVVLFLLTWNDGGKGIQGRIRSWIGQYSACPAQNYENSLLAVLPNKRAATFVGDVCRLRSSITFA